MALIPHFRVSSICMFFLLTPAFGYSAAGPHEQMLSCSGTGSQSAPASDIDYPAINQLLLSSSDHQRLTGLPIEIKKLELSKAPEASLVKQRLQFSLARSYAALNLSGPAILTLKSLPVSSPQAPEALLLLSEIEVKNGRPKAAVRWLRQMAELYPEESLSVRGLWRAAELNHPHSRQALALWQQAAQQADDALSAAQNWHAKSQQPDFLDKMNSEKLSPELWRLSRSVFTDPAFASADALQAEVRRQLQCLTANQGAQLRRMEKNPQLLADLSDTVESLAKQLDTARNSLALLEAQFSEDSQRLKECLTNSKSDCNEPAATVASDSTRLVELRTRVSGLEKRLAFLQQEEKSLRVGSGHDGGGRTDAASSLSSKLSTTKAFMQALLQESLADAVEDWQALSAEAHYRLAIAQQPRIQPGLTPPK